MTNRKGLSPVIATVLLILMGVILAVIIFLWARSFVSETAQKDIGEGPEAVELFCDDIRFDAEAYVDGSDVIVSVVNQGNIPLYGIEIKTRGIGYTKVIDARPFTDALTSGSNQQATFEKGEDLDKGVEVLISPIILGKVGDTPKAYTCEEDVYSIQTTVAEA